MTVNTIVQPTSSGRLSETIECGATRDDEDVCEDQEVVCRAEAPLCNIPKRNFTRCIVRPYHGNNCVKWDPSSASVPFQKPAQNGGDTMPDKERCNQLLNDSMDQYDDIEPEQIKRFFDATLVETFNDPQRDVKSPEKFIPPEADTKVEVISKNGSKNVESKEEPCPDLPDSGEGVLPRTGKNTRTKYLSLIHI